MENISKLSELSAKLASLRNQRLRHDEKRIDRAPSIVVFDKKLARHGAIFLEGPVLFVRSDMAEKILNGEREPVKSFEKFSRPQRHERINWIGTARQEENGANTKEVAVAAALNAVGLGGVYGLLSFAGIEIGKLSAQSLAEILPQIQQKITQLQNPLAEAQRQLSMFSQAPDNDKIANAINEFRGLFNLPGNVRIEEAVFANSRQVEGIINDLISSDAYQLAHQAMSQEPSYENVYHFYDVLRGGYNRLATLVSGLPTIPDSAVQRMAENLTQAKDLLQLVFDGAEIAVTELLHYAASAVVAYKGAKTVWRREGRIGQGREVTRVLGELGAEHAYIENGRHEKIDHFLDQSSRQSGRFIDPNATAERLIAAVPSAVVRVVDSEKGRAVEQGILKALGVNSELEQLRVQVQKTLQEHVSSKL
jgi:hypothetical protein